MNSAGNFDRSYLIIIRFFLFYILVDKFLFRPLSISDGFHVFV